MCKSKLKVDDDYQDKTNNNMKTYEVNELDKEKMQTISEKVHNLANKMWPPVGRNNRWYPPEFYDVIIQKSGSVTCSISSRRINRYKSGKRVNNGQCISKTIFDLW